VHEPRLAEAPRCGCYLPQRKCLFSREACRRGRATTFSRVTGMHRQPGQARSKGLYACALGHAGVSLSEDPGRGRNSLPHYTAMMQRDEVCTYAVEHPNACRLWWVTTHQRLNSIHHIGYPLESQRHIRKFNEGMRSWFEAGHCGPAHVVRPHLHCS